MFPIPDKARYSARGAEILRSLPKTVSGEKMVEAQKILKNAIPHFESHPFVKQTNDYLYGRYTELKRPVGVRYIITWKQASELARGGAAAASVVLMDQVLYVRVETLEPFDAMRAHTNNKNAAPWLTISLAVVLTSGGVGVNTTMWDFKGNMPIVPHDANEAAREYFTSKGISPEEQEQHKAMLDAKLTEATSDTERRAIIIQYTGLRDERALDDYLTHRLRTCGGCHCAGMKLSKCSRCRIVYYCSKACQHAHWPTHKTVCVNKK